MTTFLVVSGAIVFFLMICTLFFLYEQAVKELNIEQVKNQKLKEQNRRLKAVIAEYDKTLGSYEIATEEDVSGIKYGGF